MNKKIANIISFFIPFKITRKKFRKILIYGLLRTHNSIKVLKKLQYENIPPPHYYLAVCAIAKNEGDYFQEWIEWHKKMGVEKFYIYDNESEDDTKKILDPYIKSGLVEYVFWAGKKQQTLAYCDCLEKHKLHSRWIAFIDLDEFIVPIKDKTISEFLRRFEKFPSVEINWLVYGSSGAQKKEIGNVMDRFKHHSIPNNSINRFVKSIVDPRRIFLFIGAHVTASISGRAVDSHGVPIRKNFTDREPQHDVIRINHYAVKSYEEFLSKRNQGRVSRNKKPSETFFDNYFEKYDLNDIKENTLFYDKKCTEHNK